MPPDPLAWWHVSLGTHGSWLPGDPRGFHSRRHQTHSSGDYRSPPPAGEHADFFDAAKRACPDSTGIPPALRPRVVEALREAAAFRAFHLLAVAVGARHGHLLIRLSAAYPDAKRQVGGVKNGASFTLRDALPGTLWSAGTSPKPIKDRGHFRNTFWYVFEGQEPGAACWADVEQWRRWYPSDPRLPPRRPEQDDKNPHPNRNRATPRPSQDDKAPHPTRDRAASHPTRDHATSHPSQDAAASHPTRDAVAEAAGPVVPPEPLTPAAPSPRDNAGPRSR